MREPHTESIQDSKAKTFPLMGEVVKLQRIGHVLEEPSK